MLVSVAAQAAGPSPAEVAAKAAGLPAFADSGRFFVYRDDSLAVYGGEDSIVVYEVATGKTQAFVLDSAGGEGEPEDAAAAREETVTSGTAQWPVWLKAHPLKPARASRKSPDGSLVATVVGREGTTIVKCDQSSEAFCYQNKMPDEDCPGIQFGCGANPGKVLAQLTVKGAARPSREFAVKGLTGEVSPFWLGADRVLWFMHDKGANAIRDPETCEVVVTGPGTTVEVLADEKLLKQETRAKVSAALGKANVALVRFGTAKKARDTSVIYAAKGSEAQAKSLAALVPGGATVDALTWKSDCDLVLALGSSAK
jgi:hypothetical protein